mmetsp:Transcript_25278/g.80121  ORF Transcript_25278/g.80121 Transcript_25278/m.80121 type:complete len:229 (+) Transcript_25278:796-1482(+)
MQPKTIEYSGIHCALEGKIGYRNTYSASSRRIALPGVPGGAGGVAGEHLVVAGGGVVGAAALVVRPATGVLAKLRRHAKVTGEVVSRLVPLAHVGAAAPAHAAVGAAGAQTEPVLRVAVRKDVDQVDGELEVGVRRLGRRRRRGRERRRRRGRGRRGRRRRRLGRRGRRRRRRRPRWRRRGCLVFWRQRRRGAPVRAALAAMRRVGQQRHGGTARGAAGCGGGGGAAS